MRPALSTSILLALFACGPGGGRSAPDQGVSLVPEDMSSQDMSDTSPAELRVEALPNIMNVRTIRRRGDAVYLWHQDDTQSVVTLEGTEITIAPAEAPEAPTAPGLLPQSRVATGSNQIARAWLSGATGRYAHGVLGDAVEAETLNVRPREGDVVSFALGEDSVFEDLEPRLVDVDADGEDEILVVRAYLERGAAPMIFELESGALTPWFEAPALGTPFRWLNPVAVEDLDGDGARELAYVERPHLDGTLRVWTYRDGTLTPQASLAGFSNHGIGSTALGLSAVIPWEGGVAMLIPASGRRELRVVTYREEALEVVAKVELPREVGTDLVRLGDNVLLYADVSGQVYRVSP